MKILQNLYDSEINFSISCFWDGGIDVKLGDSMNGYKAESNVDTIEQATKWFHEQALIHFPNSQYVMNWEALPENKLKNAVQNIKDAVKNNTPLSS